MRRLGGSSSGCSLVQMFKVTICDLKTSGECRSELVTYCDEFAASSYLTISCPIEIAGFDFKPANSAAVS
jgi:hypothetical protein